MMLYNHNCAEFSGDCQMHIALKPQIGHHMTLPSSLVQYDRNCAEFSGGWQMRIALAKLLLGPAGQAAVGAGTGGLMLL